MTTSRRTFVQILGAGGLSAALSGCEQANDALEFVGLTDGVSGSPFRPPSSDEIDIESHVLDRLTWGARPGDHERVTAMGVSAFIDEQLEFDSISDRRCQWKVASIESLHQPVAELYEYNEHELLMDMTRNKLLRAVYSNRQLYEVMVDFWTDHFNIVAEKDQCRWLKAADDRDVIRAHALGSFPAMLRASALSPAMLIYLDGHDNKVVNQGDKPNENYARELLELHTLGVHGGYVQQDVMEVARCLSGWTYEHRPFAFRAAHVEFDPNRHDDGEKLVLGNRIPAGQGRDDLDHVLRIVGEHASTAKYIATKLCERFIAEVPSEDVIDAVAASFSSSGGDVRTMLRTVFDSTEFHEQRGNLVKRPFRFIVSALRTTDATTNASPQLVEWLDRMGHAPFQYPTPDGYPIESQPWLGTLLWRWKFAEAIDGSRIKGTRLDSVSLAQRGGGMTATAAHVLGRSLTDEEHAMVASSPAPLVLLLASPAFQRH